MNERKRILVVDDEPVTREMIGAILSRAGYEVIFAEDGISAIEKASSEKPGLVITDGLLPKMHGFLVCKAIKAMADAPKVILLTGVYTKPSYKWEITREYCADEAMTKPIDKQLLLKCVAKLLSDVTSIEPIIEAADKDFDNGFLISDTSAALIC